MADENKNFGTDSKSEALSGTSAGAIIGLIAGGPVGALIGAAAGFVTGGVAQEMRHEHEIEKIKEENKGKW